MPEAHAKLSPSSAYRWMNCSGSIRLSAGIKSRTSDYAEEGTAAHLVAELCLKLRCDTHELESILPQLKSRTPEAEQFARSKKWIEKELLMHVQSYIDMIRREKKLIDAALRTFNIEQRFELAWIDPDLWGTNDASIGEYLGTLAVYDLKYGAGIPVEAVDNSQLMIYALGAVGEQNTEEYDTVDMVIYQPRCFHPDGPLRRHKMPVDELTAWGRDVLAPACRATKDPKAPLHAGNWCRFCPAMGACPEIARDAMAVAQADFAQDPATVTLPDPEMLRDDQIAKVLQFSEIISAWAKQVAGHAQNILERGGAINGFKLVAKRANRKWIDTTSAEAELHQFFGNDIYTPPKLKSPAQVEKLCGKNKDFIAHLWETPNAGVTIAPADDRRKAVMPPAVIDFL